jgi:hypothetical protein
MIQIQWAQLYSSTINDPNPVGPAEELVFNTESSKPGEPS